MYLISSVMLLNGWKVLEFTEPERPNPMTGSYNPPRNGYAYSFMKCNAKIPNARKFTIDSGANKKTSDGPTIYKCNKKFPNVSLRGQTFLILLFCPMHGHCYGF